MTRPKPTDLEILAAVTDWGNQTCTYVIRNRLVSKGYAVRTPWVLRQMKRLERAGKVVRVPTNYLVQITWAVQS